jgi:hypothetical protein
MASPQFNLRLRDTLDDQVRALALQHRVNPRDVIEDALIGHYGFRRQGPGVDPDQADQRGDEPRTARRDRRKDPSGLSPTLTEPETAASGGPPAVSGRGCPECGGAWVQRPAGGWFCADCLLKYDPDA